jgi:flavin reductase (DIM6/NTAB) family NADH-FMN oxidoreductase RutF
MVMLRKGLKYALTLSEMTKDHQNFELQGEEALKSVFRNHASGIAIITSRTSSGEPIGFTASSVTSLGSNPPLVSINVGQGSSSYQHLQVGVKLAIHTLDQETLHLAKRLAGPKESRFTGDEVEGPYGIPIFSESPAVLICEVREKFEVETNAVIVATGLTASVSQVPAKPLVYFQRAWHVVGEKISEKD